MGWNYVCRRLAVLSVVFLWAAIAWGQATTSLRGTVTDPSGAAIPNATVTLSNTDTNIARTTTADTRGAYIFPDVLPGNYSLDVQASGFAKYHQTALKLLVNLPATANVSMKVGNAQETITVTEQAPIINRTDATLGSTMGTVEMENLPLQAENMNLLLSLQAGVVYNGENILTDSYDTRAGSVNGERSDQNNITLDGVSNNNEFAGYAFNGVLPSTPFSVEEFRVTTSNYGATQGRSAGAQEALVTKGGTNAFHGNLYEFNRNTLGEANDYFLKESEAENGQPNVGQHLVRNVFGGDLGGPIKKDRLFFFFNYEGHRQAYAQSIEHSVPSATLRDGIIEYPCATPSSCAGGPVTGLSGKSYTVPAGYYALNAQQLTQMDPLGIGPSAGALAYMNTYPEPNDVNYGDAPNFAGYRFASPSLTTDNWYIARIDYNITASGSQSLFFRGEGTDDHNDNISAGCGTPFLPGEPPELTCIDLAKGFVAGYTAVLNPRLVNNFRYGLTKDSYGSVGTSTQPWIFMRDLDQDVAYSGGDTSPIHNIVDTVSWQKGAHSLRFGTNILLDRLNAWDTSGSFSDGLTNADWIKEGGFANKDDGLNPACLTEFSTGCTAADTYPAVAVSAEHAYDFPLAAMIGMVSEVDGVFNYGIPYKDTDLALALPQGAPISRRWATDNYNLFVQDTWQARHNLSITYGLNYQLMTPMTEMNGQQVSPNVNMGDWFNQRGADMRQGIPDNQVNGGNLIGFAPSGSFYGRSGLYSAQTKNFAPRLGIAWSPGSKWGLLDKLFGQDKTVVRAGFGMYYDNFGPELAQSYSASGEFGLATDISNPSSTLTLSQAPRVGGSLSDMNNIPLSLLGSAVPPSVFDFPVTPQPGSVMIAHGIDQSLKTPYSYAADLSIQRQLPGGMVFNIDYVGHFAHRLLALDDIAEPMDLTDPKSGIDYFAAAKEMSKLWRSGVNDTTFTDSMLGSTAAYWQDILQPQSSYTMCSTGATTTDLLLAVYDNADCGGGNLYNESSELFDIDVAGLPSYANTGPFSFYNSQYSSLWAWRSMTWSNYNALEVGLHRQMSNGLLFGFNYTYSHSLDPASEAERGVHYLTDSIINAWDPRQMYSSSDFDLRHQINGYWVLDLPFGSGRLIGNHASGWANAIIGGWQLGGTGRWTSGFPVSVFQGYVWPTNWDEMGWSDLTGQPLVTGTTMVPIGGGISIPNIFPNAENCGGSGTPCAANAFGYAYPGESGQRNTVRGDGYFGIDMNLQKAWNVTERQQLQARWSVFNVTNSARFDAYSMQDEWDVSSTFGNYTSTLTSARVMELALIYSF
ncbi:MAG TPA: carboxypeptidase-like regulatory domain-containing protein [Candidatus Acidoferrum sp.]|nr:carboxypeptidase-like regulatory domain-containing protein [Candidatus Acidoferrum sp.]